MIQPHLQDDAFLDDVRAARSDREHFHLWWLGQSGFLLQWQGRHLLFDPYLSDSLTRKYSSTDKPHVRMTEPVIAPERLSFVDVITSSHNHTDHLDADTITPMLQRNPDIELVVPEANREMVVDRLEVMLDTPRGLDAGRSCTLAGFNIHAVPAAHEELTRDAHGRHHSLGYVVEFGPWCVYHSGDTMRYEGMVERLSRWRIDVAILPINGRAPERRVAGNLNGEEAARLARDIGAHVVIPCHYDMFEFNTATPDAFAHACEALGQNYRVLKNGEGWSSAELILPG
ncbi:MAG TPA: MBL fold metallo-hydrolase [Methylomirabilota bacterium]|nr:MBL fold metallo-hydrolase [Methylomirabilota bacterium]